MARDEAQPAAAPERALVLRQATPADRDAVVALCGSALGWRDGEADEALFRWKHEQNPAGPSPMWVAEDDSGLVGVRTFLRWQLAEPDGAPVRAVRAVDTATRPDRQGEGLFTRLTLHALPALRADGVAFVFNTPNAQSRPGYRKMGWQVVGRVPVAVGARSPAALVRTARARVPAERWSLPCAAGIPAEEALADRTALEGLLACLPAPGGLATRRTVEHLRWRYAEGPVAYRAAPVGRSLEDGVALFRVRRRGAAREVVLADVLLPDAPGLAARRRRLVAEVLRTSGADHLLAVSPGMAPPPLVRAPRLGPILTWRALTWQEMPSMRRLDLRLGDVELF